MNVFAFSQYCIAEYFLQNAKRASVAAAPLAQWVTANIKYSKVLMKIEPLEKEQNDLVK